MTKFKLIVVLFALTVQLIQINLINGDHTSNNSEQELLVNKTGDGVEVSSSSSTTGGGGRSGKRRQNKHRADRTHGDNNGTGSGNGNGNKNGWSMRRRNPSSNHNNNPLGFDELENPLFPPRSDSFWKSEQPISSDTQSHSQSQNPAQIHRTNVHYGKKSRQRVSDRNARAGSGLPLTTTEAPRDFGSDTVTDTETDGSSPSTGKSNEDMNDRPNIILIITDDQDIELGSMNYMPETLKEFRENGIEFRHGYVTTPMCCPSRSSMLTGLYVHNHQVYTNNDNCSSIQWRQKYEKKTFAYQLQESGYYTSYIGKYLNKYDGSHIPQGWNEWNTLLMNSRFYNYTVNRNGRKVRYGNNCEFDYYPDIVTNDTLEFLGRVGSSSGEGEDMFPSPRRSSSSDDSDSSNVRTGTGKRSSSSADETMSNNSNEGGGTSMSDDSTNISDSEETLHFKNPSSSSSGNNNKESRKNGDHRNRRRDSISNSKKSSGNNKNAEQQQHTVKKKPPFLLVVSYPSPHGPEDSAKKYSHLFFNATPHHTPSYNYAPNLDKQWILRVTDRMTSQLKNFTNLLMTKRLQTLQSVDEAIKQIFDKLRATKLIENTFIFYTSDHGYHVGQFGLIKGKSMPYEFDIRVPFFVRVPQNYRGHFKTQNNNHNNNNPSSQDHHTSEHEAPGRGLLINEPVLNVDLSPTFLDIGRVKVPSWIDGRSFLPLIHHYCEKDSKRSWLNQSSSANSGSLLNWGHTFIIESSGRREPLVSNNGAAGAGSSGHRNEKSNSKSEGNAKKRKFSRQSSSSQNHNIHEIPGDDLTDEDEALQNLCMMHPYPCVPRQKKYCKLQNGRVRFRKCRIGVDYEIPILPYGSTTSFVSYGNSSGIKCSCHGHGKKQQHSRGRRSTTTAVSTGTGAVTGFSNWDWDEERVKIDQEIDNLKTKIENLREKRRRLRVEWLMGMNNGELGQSPAPPRFSNFTQTSSATSLVTTTSTVIKTRGFRKEKFGRDFRFRTVEPEPDIYGVTMATAGPSENVSRTTNPVMSSSNSNGRSSVAPVFGNIRSGRPGPDAHRSDTGRTHNKNKNKVFQNPNFEEDDEGDQIISKEVEVSDDGEDDDEEEGGISPLVFHHSDEDTGSEDQDNDDDDLTTTDDHDFIQNPNRRHHGKGPGHKNRFGQQDGRGKHQKKQQQRPHRGKVGKNSGKISVSVLPPPTPILLPAVSEDEEGSDDCDCSYSPRLLRQMERDERKRRKLMSKIRKKQRFLNRIDDPGVRLQAESCGTEEKMNCFWHDNDHWRTPPLWTDGSFCFCMNANNNTYTCLRSINTTHDYLYCHFMTGFKMFFNLREDPYELHNLIGTLPASAEDWMLNQLFHLKKCQGAKDCWLGVGIQGSGSDDQNNGSNNNEEMVSLEPTIWEQIFGRWKGKRENRNGRKQKQY